jgi:4-hydroxybenzoyl-CoA thioesterase
MTEPHFQTQALVRFAHVDAAGIVFYPRYFEMVNAAVEDFFAHFVGVDFRVMHLERGTGVPTVDLKCEFKQPSRLGDVLDIGISVTRLGASSITLHFDFLCAGELRMTVDNVLVCMDLPSARAQPWPDDLRSRLQSMIG